MNKYLILIIIFTSVLRAEEETLMSFHSAEITNDNLLQTNTNSINKKQIMYNANLFTDAAAFKITKTTSNNTKNQAPKQQASKKKSELSLYEDLNSIGNFKPYVIEKIYNKNLKTLFDESIKQSYQINAQVYEIKSKEHLYDSSKNYFVPSASLTTEYKRKLYKKIDPLRADELKIELSLTMKLWSDNTDELKSSSFYSLVAEKENYNQIVNTIYSSINQNILKIELSRKFLDNAEQYRVRMNKLLERMNKAVSVGLLKKSDRLFADISIKKFEDSVLNVKSQIEIYKNTINNITAGEIYDDGYGVSQEYIDNALKVDKKLFTMNNVIKSNFDIRSRKAQLLSDKLAALGTNENFKAEIVSTQNVTGTIPVGNDRKASFSFDPNDDSFVGVKFTFSGLDYNKHKQERSETELITRKLIELDEFLYQTTINLGVLKEQYDLLNGRVKNINNQINLTLNVINSLLQELLVDESSTLDIFRNVSSLSDLELSKLAIQNELIDLVIQVYSLNAKIPDEFIIK